MIPAKIHLLLASCLLSACLQSPQDSRSADEKLYDQGVELYNNAQYEEAAKLFDKLVEKYPSSLKVDNALLKSSRARLYLGDGKKAVELLRRIPPVASSYEESLFRIGESMSIDMETYAFDSAVVAFRIYLEKFPKGSKAPAAQYEIGQNFYSMTGSDSVFRAEYYDSALLAYDAVREKWPESPEAGNALYRISWTLYQQSQWSAAADSFLVFVTDFPADASADGALYWGAKAQANDTKPCEADSLFQRLLDEYPYSDKISDTKNAKKGLFCLP